MRQTATDTYCLCSSPLSLLPLPAMQYQGKWAFFARRERNLTLIVQHGSARLSASFCRKPVPWSGTGVVSLLLIPPRSSASNRLTNTTKMISATLLHFLFFISLVPFALTCEGECITGVTSVFVGNYTVPVHFTLFDLVRP
jgi:hypothetical protein